jgi:DNA-binding MarR family transcriptional regulator
MVRSERTSADRRRNQIAPTSKGIAFAKLSWVSQQTVIERRLRGFLPVERDALQSFLRVLVGDAAYNRMKPVPGEPEMAIISRAMTYDHGVVADNYLESGYSVLDWIILSEVRYNARSASHLTILTKSSPSTISLRLKTLSGKGLISSAPGAYDKRARRLSLTRRGLDTLGAIENAAISYFSRTLRALPAERIEQGLELFRRYVDELKPDLDLELTLESVERERFDALRRRLLVTLVALGDSYPFGGTLAKPGNTIVSFGADPSTQVICECEPQGAEAYRLVNVIPLSETSAMPTSLTIVTTLERHLKARLQTSRELSAFIDSKSTKA